MGFGVPLEKWFNLELKELVMDVLSPEKIKEKGVFSEPILQKMINDYQAGKFIGFQRFYTIFVLQQWLNKWM